jgi:tetratricopeptide (TPR) repeat protein
MTRGSAAAVVLAALLVVCAWMPAGAQNAQHPGELALQGAEATPDERAAWEEVEAGRFVRARELGERILTRAPNSFMGHMVLGFAQHYAESNLPRALYHLGQALTLYEQRYGDHPGPDAPWRWHAALLRELADVHGDMEHHADKLAFIAHYNELYDPDMVAERAWPLMKLGRYSEARLAAELGLTTDRAGERVIALNALCAIEFEAGNDGSSYEACKRAIDGNSLGGSGVSAVDLTNFAEASRSMFMLDESERVSLQATEAIPSWYGNPWMELAELYVRQGRFGEGLTALKEAPRYRLKRPPHVREADRNEMRRVLASFLLVTAKPEDAYELTGRAISAPERRAHNSRDPAQDRTVLALLDRRARRMSAELVMERAATESLWRWPLAWLKATWLRVEARRSQALVDRLLSDDKRLVGSFRIGTSSAAIMPPWLLGEFCDVLGPGVVHEAVAKARQNDKRPGAAAYYDSVAAEVALGTGDYAHAVELAERSLAGLGPSEVLLSARVMAVAAEAARRQERMGTARSRYEAAFQRDPGVFRRMEFPVAVEIRSAGGELAEEVAGMLSRSPRFTRMDGGLTLAVQVGAGDARVCLTADQGQQVACAEIDPKTIRSQEPFAPQVAREALKQLFSPRIDLTQMDINSLDGQNLAGRDALETLFE